MYIDPLNLLRIVVLTEGSDLNFRTRLPGYSGEKKRPARRRSRSLRTTPFRSASSLSTTPELSQNSMTTAEGKRLETIDRDVLG